MRAIKPKEIDYRKYPDVRVEDLINDKLRIYFNGQYAKFRTDHDVRKVKRVFEKAGWRVLDKGNGWLFFIPKKERPTTFSLDDYLTGGILDDKIRRAWDRNSRTAKINVMDWDIGAIEGYSGRGWEIVSMEYNNRNRNYEIVVKLRRI